MAPMENLEFESHKGILYKCYISERVIVRNVTLRYSIINRGVAKVDNGDISDYHPLRNVIFILLYRTFQSLCEKKNNNNKLLSAYSETMSEPYMYYTNKNINFHEKLSNLFNLSIE